MMTLRYLTDSFLTRKELAMSTNYDELSNEELFGEEGWAEIREAHIESELGDYEEDLNDKDIWDLLGEDAVMDICNIHIEEMVEHEQERLESLDDEELFGEEYLEELRQREIERQSQ
jgi:hypothetical protein